MRDTDRGPVNNVLGFMDAAAVGAVHQDLKRGIMYLVTAEGIRKVEPAVGRAVTRGYTALQLRHNRAIRRRMVVIVGLVIASILLAVLK